MTAQTTIFRISASALMVFAFVWACHAGDGLRIVEERLETPSNRHYIPERRTLCFNGVSLVKCDAASEPARVMECRAIAFDKAVMEARKGLAKYLSQNLSVWENVLDASCDDASLWLSSSRSEGWSSVVLDGCVVTDFAEFFEEGELFVGVTLEWSPDFAIAAKLARTNKVYLDNNDFVQVAAWAKDGKLSAKLGPRMCSVSHNGGTWFVPTGTAAIDIEGLSRLKMNVAISKVKTDAERAFEQAVQSPLQVVFAGDSSVSRRRVGDVEDTIDVNESLASSTTVATSGMNLVRRRVAHEGVVRDSVTGRRLYVMTYVPDCFSSHVAKGNDADDF